MRKSIKIGLSVLSVLVFGLLLLYTFRNEIAAYTLHKVVGDQSGKKITLILERIDFDPFKGSLSIYRPSLQFTDIYLDQKESMKVNHLSFQELGVYNVSFVDLLMDKRFVADKLLVLKPSVHFEKHILGEEADSSRFSPDKLLSLLNTNSESFTRLKFNIREIEIGYGSINLHLDTLTDYAPDSLDFTILLKGFVTQAKTKVPVDKRILYSDEVIFSLKNISKRLNSAYDLHIDSLTYNSRLERISSAGLSLTPLPTADKEKKKSSIKVNWLKVDGFGVVEIRGKEKLHLSAIAVSGVSLTTQMNKKAKQQDSETQESTQLKELPGFFNDFRLDSLIFSSFTIFNIKGETDTVLSVENIGLLVKNIAFDSTLPADPFRLLQMGEVFLSTEKLKLSETEKGIHLAYSNFAYSSEIRQLVFKQLRVVSDSVVFQGPKLKLDLHDFRVDGFSIHDFFQKKKQILSLKLNQAVMQIGLQQKIMENENIPKKQNEYLKLLEFKDLSVENSSLNLSSSNEFNIDFNGINLETSGFKFIEDDSAKRLTYDKLYLDVEGISAVFSHGNSNLKTARFVLDNQDIEVSTLQAVFRNGVDKKYMTGEFNLRNLQVSSFDLNSLIFAREFNAGSVDLIAPVLRGNLTLADSAGSARVGNEQSSPDIPLSFQIGRLSLRQGHLNFSLEKAGDTIHLQTKVDLQLGQLNSNDTSFIGWLAPADWEIELNEIDMSSAAYVFCANRLKLNPRQSLFELSQLNLLSKPHAKHLQNQFEIEKITLPEIKVSGLDYGLLFVQDSIRFEKLTINNPELSLKLFPQETDSGSKKPPAGWNIENLLPSMVYDTIDLKGLHLNLDKSSDSSHTLVGMHNLSIEHLPGKQANLNLFHETAFQLDEFYIRDSVAHTFLNLHEIVFVPESTTLTINGVNWSKTYDSIKEGDVSVRSSKIVFTGAYLRQTLPSRLNFGKLRFFDVDVNVTTGKKGESDQKRELDFNLRALKKYSVLLSRLAIDTTVFDDVSVHYTTFDSSQQHTIQADSIGLVINRIDIDTNMFDQENPILINNLIVDLNGRTQISNDSLYEIQTGRIHYNFPEHQITIDSFYVLPRFGEAECFKRARYQKGIINLFGRKLEINGFRVDKLLNDNELHFGGVDVFDLKFNIVKDKKYPIKPGTYKKMPQELIRGIAQKFRIDSVRIFNSYVYFKLYPEKKTNKPGEIMLTNINASAYNFTNIISSEDNTTLDVLLSADIMGESRMDVDFHFPLYDTANHWWFGFKTEKIDFVKLNSMTQNLVGLTILKGKGSVEAPLIRGDNFNTTGTMIFRYRKMRLSLYSRKRAETETGLFSSMANFVINDLVLKSNNPKFARKPRVGHVYTARNTQKDIVNFAFKSLLSGMLSTLGINKKEQRKERKVYKKEEKQK